MPCDEVVRHQRLDLQSILLVPIESHEDLLVDLLFLLQLIRVWLRLEQIRDEVVANLLPCVVLFDVNLVMVVFQGMVYNL
ncbi:hypothetical protein GW750_03620 [bacterium]|nr:hypothetical protein [bacterium]